MKGQDENWLGSGGVMAQKIRAKDWGRTPLGPMANWPVTLWNSLHILLDVPLPMVVCWGDDLLALYNDAYQVLLSNKSDCLGQPLFDIWPETADTIQPHIDKALGGEASFIEDFTFESYHSNGHDQTCFDYHVNPLRDESGDVSGIVLILIKKDERSASKKNQVNRIVILSLC